MPRIAIGLDPGDVRLTILKGVQAFHVRKEVGREFLCTRCFHNNLKFLTVRVQDFTLLGGVTIQATCLMDLGSALDVVFGLKYLPTSRGRQRDRAETCERED